MIDRKARYEFLKQRQLRARRRKFKQDLVIATTAFDSLGMSAKQTSVSFSEMAVVNDRK